MKARPFVKWVGGKTQLLPELLKRIPKTWNRETDLYCEPFVGGGALFWELRPKRAILNDANEELFITWLAFNSCYIEDLFQQLGVLAYNYRVGDPEEVFQQVRGCIPHPSEIGARAARTIFLNKTCFNGLYRVNRAGQFNAPWGHNPKATVFDEENLNACRDVLTQTDLNLLRGDFDEVGNPPAGTLWYADPPYAAVSKTSNFTSYTVDGFTYSDQLRLVVTATRLRAQGVHVLLSQAADENLVDQYRRCGFQCDLVQARRAVNSVGSKRGKIGEYIIY
jgi:DNA adenine methylase